MLTAVLRLGLSKSAMSWKGWSRRVDRQKDAWMTQNKVINEYIFEKIYVICKTIYCYIALIGARELEITAGTVRDSVRSLENDKMRIKTELSNCKLEEEELRSNIQNLKLCCENDTRMCEDTRRRLLLLSEEESTLKETESRLKMSLNGLKKNIEEIQVIYF